MITRARTGFQSRWIMPGAGMGSRKPCRGDDAPEACNRFAGALQWSARTAVTNLLRAAIRFASQPVPTVAPAFGTECERAA
jgi:hypothetical protein